MTYAVFAALLLICYPAGQAAASPGEKMVLADFDRNDKAQVMGVFDRNPMDNDQWISMSFVDGGAFPEKENRFLLLDYDVESGQPAKAVFWFKLKNTDLSDFDSLHLFLKADPETGGTKNVIVEFTDQFHRRAPYVLTGISEEWQEFSIPFKRFSRIRDWSSVKQFSIVLDDIYSLPKKGKLFVDEIFVIKS